MGPLTAAIELFEALPEKCQGCQRALDEVTPLALDVGIGKMAIAEAIGKLMENIKTDKVDFTKKIIYKKVA